MQKELQIIILCAGKKKITFFFPNGMSAKCNLALLHITELCEALIFSSSFLFSITFFLSDILT